MDLDTYLKLAKSQQQCQICTFRDKYEDMIVVEHDGEDTTVHKECLEAQKEKNNYKLAI